MFLILKTLRVLCGKNTHEQIIIYWVVRERFLKMQLKKKKKNATQIMGVWTVCDRAGQGSCLSDSPS